MSSPPSSYRLVVYLDRRAPREMEAIGRLSRLVRPQELLRRILVDALLAADFSEDTALLSRAASPVVAAPSKATPPTVKPDAAPPMVPVIGGQAARDVANIFGNQQSLGDNKQ